ncbi:phosphotransferase family protein [Nonomuraea sp. NPDC049269]|uniref:phosphotransferase family protein n=1 Tax=Nonomuraea sp. NPDC049269 TaxID=3364349 RepID=UPI00372044F8
MTALVHPEHDVPRKTAFTAGLPVLDEVAAIRILISCGALRPEQAADPRLTITDESRRCRCLIVRLGSAGWVVKQGTTAESRESMRQEAAVYRALQPTAFTPHLPGFLAYEEETGLLVTEFVESKSPREVNGDEPERRTALALGIGTVLARLHRLEGDLGLDDKPPPPILRCGYPTLDSVEFHSPASLEVIRTVQANDTLMSLLATVTERWTPEVVTHNDLRGDNILLRDDDEPVLIDWEMGGWGDRRWDIAGLLSERLVWWLTDPDLWVPWNEQVVPNEAAVAGMREIRDFAHVFLGGYLVALTGSLDLRKAGLSDLMTWCAARLVHFAIENTHQRNTPQVTARQLMQMAANFHQNPEVAARTFFGLALSDVG